MTYLPTADATIGLLAQTTQWAARGGGTTRPAAPQVPINFLRWPNHWPGQSDMLRWASDMPGEITTVFIVAGIIFLLWGFYLHKGLVVLNAAAFGALLGAAIGDRTGAAVPGAVLGGFTAGAVSVPLMKWMVAGMGGLVGAVVGGSVWRMTGLDPHFAWSGAVTGMVGFGLLCFIVPRFCLVMNTSLQGSAMLVIGVLSLLFKYKVTAPNLTEGLLSRPSLLPMTLFVLTVAGMFYQQSTNKPKPPGGPPPPKK